MENTLDFAAKLATQAGELLLDYYRRRNAHARLKADKSVVTEADLAADTLIASVIHEHFPGEAILSEELQPSLRGGNTNAVWVIDPLDGTTNFSLGLPFWGVSIARLEDGVPQVGVLYFPCLEELYTAHLGDGAACNGAGIHVKPPDPNQPWSFFSCCSRTFRQYEISIPYKPRILGSAAYSLCCAARGIALVAFEATAKVWDIAAAWLLIQEAGGVVKTLDGSQPFPLRDGLDYSQEHFPTLAAATPERLSWAKGKIRKLGE